MSNAKSWFPLYPGDYLRDTLGLSSCEHGCYLLLLMNSWSRGSLPDDLDRLQRISGNPPMETLRYILETYWERVDTGWVNRKLEEVRQKQIEHSERLSAAGKKGMEKRWGGDKQAIARLKPGYKEAIANQSQSQSQSQSHNQRKDSSPLSTEGKCPQQKLRDLYHSKLPTCPKIRSWTETRERYLRARWKEHPDISWWEGFLEYISESKFLTGRTNGNGDKPPFIADFEWILKPSNFAKINEGKYHR